MTLLMYIAGWTAVHFSWNWSPRQLVCYIVTALLGERLGSQSYKNLHNVACLQITRKTTNRICMIQPSRWSVEQCVQMTGENVWWVLKNSPFSHNQDLIYEKKWDTKMRFTSWTHIYPTESADEMRGRGKALSSTSLQTVSWGKSTILTKTASQVSPWQYRIKTYFSQYQTICEVNIQSLSFHKHKDKQLTRRSYKGVLVKSCSTLFNGIYSAYMESQHPYLRHC